MACRVALLKVEVAFYNIEMVKPHTYGELHREILRAGTPDRVANVLHDAGPERLRDASEQRLVTATPELRARLLGRTAAKPTHVVWALGLATNTNEPVERLHDYSLHGAATDYAGTASCSPEVHSRMRQYVQQWHNHRYEWFVTMMLLDHGYTEERLQASEDALLTPGPTPPAGYGSPSVSFWQPSAADLQRKQIKTYARGDIAIMRLNDLHRLRDQCGALTFFVQGPVAREASTVFDDDMNVLFQPSDSGPTRLANLLQRLGSTSMPTEIHPNLELL